MLEPAVHTWSEQWANKSITVHSDNIAAVSIINKGSSKDPLVMSALRNIFWLSALYNFKLKAVYYPGKHNILADAASRLHQAGSWERLQSGLRGTFLN